MSQNLFYPPGLGPSGGSASTGTNGAPAPTSSTEVGGINPSGNLQPLLTDASGNLFVNVAAGSITAENPSVSLTSALVPTYATYVGMNVSGDLVGLQGTANGLKVDGSAVTQPISAVSLPLPTGAATNAELVTINTTLGSPFQAGGSIGNTAFGISGSLPAGSNAIGSVSVSNFPATQPVSGTVTANQGGTWNITDVSGTVSLPTGAATAANQTSVIGSTTGGSAATNSELVGGVYNSTLPTLTNGQQAAIQLDSSGRVILSPSGASSNVNLATVGGSAIALGQTTMSASLPVAIASNQSAITVAQATAANLNATVTGTVGVSGNVTVTQATGSNLHVDVDNTVAISAASLPLPTGAATSANQSTMITDLGTIITNTTGLATSANQTNASQKTQIVDGSGNVIASTSNALNVNVNNSPATSIKGTALANAPVYNAYSSTSITTGAYVQLVASTSNAINTVHIFDSSGQAMIFGIGASGSEVATLYVPPGGDTYTLTVPAGSRIAYKALTATAASGYLLMSFLE
jgi:hypothetical protein